MRYSVLVGVVWNGTTQREKVAVPTPETSFQSPCIQFRATQTPSVPGGHGGILREVREPGLSAP